ncbi:YqzG/YhdC family protein [Paenibacillus glycanilyticus]|uniref:YqzG/YhdC family protein n=1 Tax=Paenibacillus glycanilyticus TaxID=126569 RepID=UPI001910D6A9|nr:YqzG/YhdC family protein [Paenibacillus glycanilyticus]
MGFKKGRLLIYMLIAALFAIAVPSAAHAEPSYAKYGKIAMQETANKYPDADIIDYKYEGHFTADGSRTEERFKLWLRGNGAEFGVRVHIFVAADTGQVRDVRIEELRG